MRNVQKWGYTGVLTGKPTTVYWNFLIIIMIKKEELNVLIVDDEPGARLLLRKMLEEMEHVNLLGEAGNVEEALYLIVKNEPDLVFLDINMPGKTGMELAELIRQRNIGVSVIFTSGYIQYTHEAIRNQFYDFLLKPVDYGELGKIIEKYRLNKEKSLEKKIREVLNNYSNDNLVRINSKHSYVLLKPDQVLYCETESGYTNIIMEGGKTEVSSTNLTVLEELLRGYNFFRISRSVIINTNFLKRVDKIRSCCVLEADGKEIELKGAKSNIKTLMAIEI